MSTLEPVMYMLIDTLLYIHFSYMVGQYLKAKNTREWRSVIWRPE